MDEEVLEKLVVAETPCDVQAIVADCDIVLSDEDAARLFSELEKIRTSAIDGEMSDSELAGIAGGFSFGSLWGRAKSIAMDAWDDYGKTIKDAAKGLVDKL